MMNYSLRSLLVTTAMVSLVYCAWRNSPTLAISLLLLGPLPVLIASLAFIPQLRRRLFAVPVALSSFVFYIGLIGPLVASTVHPSLDGYPSIGTAVRSSLPATHGWLLSLPQDTALRKFIQDYQLGWCGWGDPAWTQFRELY